MAVFIRHLFLLPAFIGQFLKARMAYRLDFLFSAVTTIFTTLMGLAFVFVVFSKIESLDSWSYHQVLFIYGFSLIPLGIFSMVSWNLWDFGSKYIIEGNFDRIMLRPLHSLYQIYFEQFRVESIPDMIVGLYIVIYSSNKLGLHFGLFDIVAFVILTISAAIILLSFFSMLASINFWAEDRVGLGAPLYNMIPMGRYPTTVYNNFIKFLLSTVFPFAYVSFYPSTFFLGRNEFVFFVVLTPLVALLSSMVTLAIWKRGVRRYGSTGS